MSKEKAEKVKNAVRQVEEVKAEMATEEGESGSEEESESEVEKESEMDEEEDEEKLSGPEKVTSPSPSSHLRISY